MGFSSAPLRLARYRHTRARQGQRCRPRCRSGAARPGAARTCHVWRSLGGRQVRLRRPRVGVCGPSMTRVPIPPRGGSRSGRASQGCTRGPTDNNDFVGGDVPILGGRIDDSHTTRQATPSRPRVDMPRPALQCSVVRQAFGYPLAPDVGALAGCRASGRRGLSAVSTALAIAA